MSLLKENYNCSKSKYRKRIPGIDYIRIHKTSYVMCDKMLFTVVMITDI